MLQQNSRRHEWIDAYSLKGRERRFEPGSAAASTGSEDCPIRNISLTPRGADTPTAARVKMFRAAAKSVTPLRARAKRPNAFPCAASPDHKRGMFGSCRLGSTAIGKTQFQTFDPSPHPSIGRGRGGCTDVLASPWGWALTSMRSSLRQMAWTYRRGKWRFEETSFDLRTSPLKNGTRRSSRGFFTQELRVAS